MGAYFVDIMSPRTRREKYRHFSLDAAGTVPIAPSRMPVFKEDFLLLAKVEDYAGSASGLQTLVQVANDVLLGIHRFCELAMSTWEHESLKAAAVCKKAVAFQNAYESVHQIIRTTEAEDYGAYLRAAATAMVAAEVVTPPTALDEITDIGE